ncbi:hypothetical protein Ancab_010609 [Ancistrocladus abbreviatus]
MDSSGGGAVVVECGDFWLSVGGVGLFGFAGLSDFALAVASLPVFCGGSWVHAACVGFVLFQGRGSFGCCSLELLFCFGGCLVWLMGIKMLCCLSEWRVSVLWWTDISVGGAVLWPSFPVYRGGSWVHAACVGIVLFLVRGSFGCCFLFLGAAALCWWMFGVVDGDEDAVLSF